MPEIEGSHTVPTFSERMGFKPAKSAIQLHEMDDELRNSLWNLVLENRLDGLAKSPYVLSHFPSAERLLQEIWANLLKRRVDELPNGARSAFGEIKTYFFGCEWHEVYSFVEFVVNMTVTHGHDARAFIAACNGVLEQEMSGYRFVGTRLVPITSAEELAALDEALAASQGDPALRPVTDHLTRATELLADRQNPDYRNSIKESISAVEALCRLVLDNPRPTLGEAIKLVETKLGLHPALKSAFSNLYGYTSDAHGIRHSLMEQQNLGQEDATYMLVSCAAFVNYLVAKASKANITLDSR